MYISASDFNPSNNTRTTIPGMGLLIILVTYLGINIGYFLLQVAKELKKIIIKTIKRIIYYTKRIYSNK
jgi:hypothetical protein